jgi:hypothetical protein
MKKLLSLVLVLCLMLTACAPETVREGGVVLHGNPRETTDYLTYYQHETIVYVTKSGEKYHTADCSYLTDSAMPVSLEQAVAEGKTPCSRCHPGGE